MRKNPIAQPPKTEIYVTADGEVTLEVPVERDTVWLSQAQLVKLFGRSQPVISRHVRNVFTEGELPEGSNMQKVHITGIDRPVVMYSLDVVISVGYRVKSHRGTQFRIWATQKLRDYLVNGYTLNRRLLDKKGVELEQVIKLLGRTMRSQALVADEGAALLDIVGEYARTWRLLLQYDEDRFPAVPGKSAKRIARLTLTQARGFIAKLKNSLKAKREASDLFGHERGDGLAGILGNIEQSFGGEDLYPSVEIRAAHLLYFVIKDHPFSDGNKRIGSVLFLSYLDRNHHLVRLDGSRRFDDNALVALALLVAESAPGQKDLMIRLIVGLLEDVAETGQGS
jgi:prophage maintenance system killer protein